jgi:acetolactate synthase I/II/III large subunit
MKLSDYVMQFVAAQGVKHVFFVPGGGAMHLNDSLGRCDGLEYVSDIHEQATAIAAEAYARVSGNLGVAMVTTGPGGTNAVTGTAAAWLDSTPVLFLSGQVKRPDIKAGTGLRQLGVQEIDIVAIVGSITKYAAVVTDPQTIRFHLEKALHVAHEGRPGPVWIDIPLDVQAATVDEVSLPGFTPQTPKEAAVSADLAAAATRTLDLLRASERPVIMAGNGIRVAGAVELFERLIGTLRVPVLTTWLGLDLLPDNHPLNAGRPGSIAPRSANFALQNCDFFLSIGSRLDMALTGYAHDRFARAAKKIIVDIDEAEIAKLGMNIDIPVVADAGLFMKALLEVIEEQARPLPAFGTWKTRITDWKRRYPLETPPGSRSAEKLSAYDFFAALSDAIPEGALIVPGSSGFASEIFLLMLKIKRGQRCFHNRGTGSMGFAIPAALGACLAAGRKTTVSVDGDGGFQFNVQELATVAALDLPLKFFVINNNGYASIRSSQNGYFNGNLVGCDPSSGLTLPDLGRIAAAFGIRFQRIIKGDDLSSKIRGALEFRGPMICEVVVIPDEPRQPRLSSMRREDGSMVSKPLEDLFPFLDRDEFHANMLIPTIDE